MLMNEKRNKILYNGKKPVCLIKNTIFNSTDQTIYRVKKGFVDALVLGLLDPMMTRVLVVSVVDLQDNRATVNRKTPE